MANKKWKILRITTIALLLVALLVLSTLQVGIKTDDNYIARIVIGTQSVEAQGLTQPDYYTTGTNDNVIFQQALNALPSTGGLLQVLTGTYNFSATVSRAINNVTIIGTGAGTLFNNNGVMALFSVGAQTGWKFQDLRTDAGGITNSSLALLDRVTIGVDYIDRQLPSNATGVDFKVPTGRGTYVIAASNATTLEKNQADVICDNVADNSDIITAYLTYKNIQLTSGTYTFNDTSVTIPANGALVGTKNTTINVNAASLHCAIVLSDGVLLSTLNISGNNPVALVANVTGVQVGNNCTIKDLNLTNLSGGIYITDKHDVTITDYTATGLKSSSGYTEGIIVHGSYNVWGKNININDSNRGIEIEDGSYNIEMIGGSITNIQATVPGDMSLDAHTHNAQGATHDIVYRDFYLSSAPGIEVGGVNATDCVYNVTFDNINQYLPTTNMSVVYGTNITFNKVYLGVTAVQTTISFGNNTVFNNCTWDTNTTVNYIFDEDANSKGTVIDKCKMTVDGSPPNYFIRILGTNCNITNNKFFGNPAQSYVIRLGGNGGSLNGNYLEYDYIWLDTGATNYRIFGNKFDSGGVYFTTVLLTNVVIDNVGKIATGEIRTISGTISTLTQNAYNSVDNPFGQTVRVLSLNINVSTGATATTPNIDCGIGNSATTDYTTLFDDLPGETVGYYTSTIAVPGTQTVPQTWASGGGNRYLNMSIKDAAATGMVATWTATIMGN